MLTTTSFSLSAENAFGSRKNLVPGAPAGEQYCAAVTLNKGDAPRSWMAVRQHLVNSLEENTTSKSALQSFLLSTDITAARRALLLIFDLAADLHLVPELRQPFWQSRLLNDGIWYASSVDAAIAADVIVVSVNRKNEITPVLRCWIKDCLSQKSAEDAVLLTLGSAGSASNPAA